jgi:Tetratricopeptide repeat
MRTPAGLVLLILLAAFNPSTCFAEGSAETWEQLDQKGRELARAGDLKQSRTKLEQALERIRGGVWPGSEHIGVVLNDLGYVCLEGGDYSAAESYLSQSIQALDEHPNADRHDVAGADENLGRLYWRKGQFELAQPLLLRALSLQEGLPDLSKDYLATRFENLGRFFSQKDEAKLSEEYFEKALKLRRTTSTPDPKLCNCLVDTADACLLQKKNAEAKVLLTQALQIAERQFGVNSENAGDLRARIKDCQLRTCPTFEIISPKPDETFDSQPILVQITVHDLELKTPQSQFGKAPGYKTGHIHYMLDDHPPVATSATQIMMEGGPAFLTPGEHTLWVELVDETHHPLAPPVRHRVKFKTN